MIFDFSSSSIPEWMYWLMDWVTVGDGRVCPDCVSEGNMPPRMLDQFPYLPREGGTVCDGDCRCMLLPHDLYESEMILDGLNSIIISDYISIDTAPIKIIEEFNYFIQVNNLVLEYENLSSKYYDIGDWNLPDKYYDQVGSENKRDYLEKLLYRLKENKLTEIDKKSILRTNRFDSFPKYISE